MNLFTQLRHHAQVRPEAVAIYSQERVTTYRKLWSRIERATARLQGEWRIHAGDRVAYLGKGHPDAIVLYASLARSGALLVPLKPAMPQSLIESALRKTDVRMVVHDDDHAIDGTRPAVEAKPLSELIATPCPCEPDYLVEQSGRSSLIAVSLGSDGNLLIVPHETECSTSSLSDMPAGESRIGENLFDEAIFVPVALRTLMAGNMLVCD